MTREDVCKAISSLKGEAGHRKVLETYNAQVPLPRGYRLRSSDPWCAATVSAVFLMQGYNGFSECSCPQMIKKAMKLGIWIEDDNYVPEIGDVIMYDWQDLGWGDNVGVADHVGIVIGISDNNILVREGNYNGSVRDRSIRIGGKYIRGYIIPPYESKVKIDPNDEPQKPATVPEKSEYTVGKVYTVSVRSSLNVRKGPGLEYAHVGYANLTEDGKKHANSIGALLPGTKVTCLEIAVSKYFVWMRIPSGWICARMDGNIYVS